MSYVPRNAKKILENAKLMREYALKPYGFNIPTNSNFPKKQPEYKFFELDVVLHRPGEMVAHEPNTLQFKVNEDLSKPEIKQYLEKLYNLKIEKINTARFMGKVYKTQERKPKRTPNFKKAFVMTEHKIPEFLNRAVL